MSHCSKTIPSLNVSLLLLDSSRPRSEWMDKRCWEPNTSNIATNFNYAKLARKFIGTMHVHVISFLDLLLFDNIYFPYQCF